MASNEIVYSLATFENSTINGVRDLTEEEYVSYSQDISLLEKFSHNEQIFRLIELNHIELSDRISHYIKQYSANANMDFSKLSNQFLDLNRLILNLLSSIRTYLDHTETRLKREYGNDSEEIRLFKKLTANVFDTYFAYRFLSKLRNYSQHCGLPSGSLSINSKVGTNDSLTLFLVRDELLNQFDSWGTIIKPELQNQEEQFDILPLIEIKVSLLKQINLELNDLFLKRLSKEGNNLLSLIVETQTKNTGTPCILKIFGKINNPTFIFKWFPYKIISRITGIEFVVNDILN